MTNQKTVLGNYKLEYEEPDDWKTITARVKSLRLKRAWKKRRGK